MRILNRIFCMILGLLSLFAVFMEVNAAQISKQEEVVLIVCRQNKEFTFIENLVTACGKKKVSVLETDYNTSILEGINYVVTTSKVPLADCSSKKIKIVCMGDDFVDTTDGWKEYRNVPVQFESKGYTENKKVEKFVYMNDNKRDTKFGQVIINNKTKASFATLQKGVYYIPFYREEGICTAMTGSVLQSCFGNENAGNMYFMIDEIYTFSDLDVLCSFADTLSAHAIPFLVRIMPVYENLEYPSFKRYMQVLRYVQEKNGTIVIHEPFVREGESEREPIEDKMKRFVNKLEEENIHYMDFSYSPYMFTWKELNRIQSKQKNFGIFSFDSMFGINMNTTEEEFLTLIESINEKWMSFGDYKEKFTTQKFQYKSEEIEEEFTYREKEEIKFASFFSASDRILLYVVGASVFVLSILLIIGRRWYRKKFYK